MQVSLSALDIQGKIDHFAVPCRSPLALIAEPPLQYKEHYCLINLVCITIQAYPYKAKAIYCNDDNRVDK